MSFANLQAQNCAENCQNLVQNPDLLESNLPNPADLSQAYDLGYITGWTPTFNSPHLAYQQQNGQCQVPSNYNPATGNTLFNCMMSFESTNQLYYIEGIKTDIDFTDDPFLSYCISLEARAISCSPPISPEFGTLNLRAATGLTQVSNNQLDPTNLPTIVGQDIGSFNVNSTLFQSFSVTNYVPNDDYDEFELYVVETTTNGNSNFFCNIRNVEVTCETTALDGITSSINGSAAIFKGINLSGDDFVSYLWDFGDGTSSTNEIGTHIYDAAGTYQVCLSIVDVNGCCATICETVVISEMTLLECDVTGENYLFFDGNNTQIDQLSELVAAGIFVNNQTISNMEIVVDGNFTLDAPSLFTDCHFFFTPGSGFTIDLVSSIRLNNSTLEGCDKMWKGIHVFGYAPNPPNSATPNFAFHQNTIKDAYTALVIGEYANISNRENVFDENYIGVYSPPNGTMKTHSGGGIIGCTFKCSDQLKPAYTGQPHWADITHAGVMIYDLNNIVIQKVEKMLPPFNTKVEYINSFENISNGILLRNTNNTIIKNEFLNMLGEAGTIGISSVSKGYGIKIERTPVTLVQSNSMQGGFRAIECSRANAGITQIEKNTIEGSPEIDDYEYGIRVFSLEGGLVSVQENIMHFQSDGFNSSLDIHQLNNMTNFIVDSNDADVNSCFKPSMRFYEVNMAQNEFGFVRNNSISSVSSVNLCSGNTAEMSFSLCENLSVENNVLTTDLEGHGGSIGISSTTMCHFRENQIINNGNNQGTWGFNVIASPSNLFCCNEVSNCCSQGNTIIGMAFTGQCNNTNLSTNTVDNYFHDFVLWDAVISSQINKGNLWEVSPSRASIFSYITGHPNSYFSGLANQSTFEENFLTAFVNPNNLFPTYLVGTWFINDVNLITPACEDVVTCGVPLYGFKESNNPSKSSPCVQFESILEQLNNHTLADEYSTQGDWTFDYYLYLYLQTKHNSEWQLCDEFLDYFSSKQVVKEYVDVNAEITKGVNPDLVVELFSYNETIRETLESIREFLLAMESDSTISTQSEEYVILVEQLSDEIDAAEQISVQLDEQEEAWLSTTTSLIENLPEEAYFHADLKFAIKENLFHRFNSQDLDIEALKVIASKCFMRYGQASLKANGILQYLGHSDMLNAANCGDLEMDEDKTSDETLPAEMNTYASPNPLTSNEFTIKLDSKIDLSTLVLKITTDKGQLVEYSSIAEEHTIQVTLFENVSGFIIVQVYQGSELIDVLKVLKI